MSGQRASGGADRPAEADRPRPRSFDQNRAGCLWAAPAALMLAGLLVWPLIYLVRLSLCEGGNRSGFGLGTSFYRPGTWTTQVYGTLASEKYFQEVLGYTVQLGLVTTVVCVLLGFPVAHCIWRLPRRWKPAALACVIMPKLASLLVTVYGLKIILGDHGPVNRFLMWTGLVQEPLALQHSAAGVVIGKTLLVLPYTILLIWSGLERLDRGLLAAARGLGAGPWGAFVRVTLPLSLPSVGAAALVSLIWALGAFISPYLLGSPEQITLAVDVQRQMFENLHWPRAAAEGVMLLLTLVVITGLCAWLRRRFAGRFQESGGRSRAEAITTTGLT